MVRFYDISANNHTIGIVKTVDGIPTVFTYRLPHEPINAELEYFVENISTAFEELAARYTVREIDYFWPVEVAADDAS